MNTRELWERYRALLFDDPALGVRLDLSRMGIDDAALVRLEPALQKAYQAMAALEKGEIANPDEKRMVGHYWLRAPQLAPTPEIADEIRSTQERTLDFASRVHDGRVSPPRAERFRHLLVVGIGGSALGPQLVADALSGPGDRLRPHFLDNTDPDGIDRVLGGLGEALAETLVVVISKSGGTPETRNGMLEAAAAWTARGLAFGPQAVAVTQQGSALDRQAGEQGFLERFPMWDWVGGRTSVTSAVGLVPAALQGIDVGALLEGAAAMDAVTRRPVTRQNPAALLALAWHVVGEGRGSKRMVVLPYKDRLLLFSRYLQQLVMESLGKEKDREGRVVHQGLTVYGNKGTTDQHAYLQQLRDGTPDFFVTFVRVLRERVAKGIEVEPGVTSGDYLDGLMLGTRRALFESGRPSLTLTLPDVSPRSLGTLIALYERAVGLYASLVGINAYHQPGVEAGKKAAAAVLDLQRRLLEALAARQGKAASAEELARAAGSPDEVETVFLLLERLSANPGRGVVRRPGPTPESALYSAR
ncbi:MAG TPA: glucose-6-phosphate isomerase [Vicinamibacteria bacterium]|nr:glucose-6-phosphate isomerase [Vicinamibacteria bacterium]